MKQVEHIFGKDVRHLWPQIVIAVAIAVCHAGLDVLQTPVWTVETRRVNGLAQMSGMLLVLAWWNLIAAAVNEEMLPGDRQFWLTRPYSWKCLLGAKLLFLLAFVSAPLLISDCFILGAQGFPIVSNIPDLLIRQFAVSGWLILPALALAAVTSGLGQFILGLLLVFVAMMSESMITALFHSQARAHVLVSGTSTIGLTSASGQGTDFLLILVLVGGTVWQFAKRKTGVVRVMMAAVAFVVVPAFSAISWPHKATREGRNEQIDLSGLRLSYDLTRSPVRDLSQADSSMGMVPGSVVLPVRVTGLPEGTALTGGGEVVVSGQKQGTANTGFLRRGAAGYVHVITVDAASLASIKSHQVGLRSSLYLTVVTDRASMRAPIRQQTINIPDVGRCEQYVSPGDYPALLCRAGVREPETTRVSMQFPDSLEGVGQMGMSARGREVFGGLTPVEKWVTPLQNARMLPSSAADLSGAELVFTPQRPLADITRQVEITNMDVSQYVWPGRD